MVYTQNEFVAEFMDLLKLIKDMRNRLDWLSIESNAYDDLIDRADEILDRHWPIESS